MNGSSPPAAGASRLTAGAARLAAVGIVGAGAATLLSQPLGSRVYRGILGKSTATLQTLTPHLAGATATIAALALVRRRPVAAATAATVATGSSALAAPLVFGRSRRRPVAPAVSLRIATANLLYTNGETRAVADDLLEHDFDVIAFTEYTAEHREVLHGHALAKRMPYRIDREGPRALGVAVWSRVPLETCPPVATVNHSIDVRVEAPAGAFRILALHTPTPYDDVDGWADDLDLVRDLAAACPEPMVVIGDLNATCWHPAVRSILRDGYSDALVAAGKPFTASWPIGSIIPPLAQLDHALVGPGLTVTDAANFPVPGSDHRGLSVTVAPAG